MNPIHDILNEPTLDTRYRMDMIVHGRCQIQYGISQLHANKVSLRHVYT